MLHQSDPLLTETINAAAATPSGTLDLRERGEVAFLKAGQGSPQLAFFIHGTPGAASDWERVIGLLEEREFACELVSLDRPGFGKNRDGSGAVGFSEQIDAFWDVLENLRDRERRLVLVGHSYGAALAVGLAARLQGADELAGLVLVSGVLSPELIQRRWYHEAILLPVVRLLAPWRYVRAGREMSKVKPRLREFADLWAGFDFPVSLIHGEADRLIPIANSEYARDRLPQDSTRFIRIAGAGHALTKTHPEVIAAEIECLFELINQEGAAL